MLKRVKIVCAECGSEDVSRDATAGEANLEEVEITEETCEQI